MTLHRQPSGSVARSGLFILALASLALSQSLADEDTQAIVHAALVQEFTLMSRPMNDFEDGFMDAKRRSDVIAANVYGEAYMKDEGRVPVEFVRAPESLTILNNAANLCDEEQEEELRKLVNLRAVDRGGQVLSLANDDGVGLFVRESLMRHSIEYFRIGEDPQRQAMVEAQRRLLEPEVRRAEAQRKVLVEKFQDDMQPFIEEFRQGASDMLKTDAEKQDFDEEVSALEEELGL